MLGGVTPSPSPTTAMAAQAAAIDPTLLALLSIFGGAALTVIAGFVGAAIQSRNEHAKWLRERRFEAFQHILSTLKKMRAYEDDWEKSEHDRLRDSILEESEVSEDEMTAEQLEDIEARIVRTMGPRPTLREKRAALRAVRDEIGTALVELGLLGTSEVTNRSGRAVSILTEHGGGDQFNEAEADLALAMRKALSVHDDPWWRRFARRMSPTRVVARVKARRLVARMRARAKRTQS